MGNRTAEGKRSMDSDEHYWEAVQTGRERISSLLMSAQAYLKALPKITRLVEWRNRAAQRFGQTRSAKKACRVYEDHNSKVQKFYDDFRSFTNEALKAIESLRGVLPSNDVERLKAQIHPNTVDATHQALRHAALRLEEFWEARPTNQVAPRDRETRLQEFVKRNETTIAAVVGAAEVHKPQMQDWRHGKLPDRSVMSQRIEEVLSGRRPLKPRRVAGQRLQGS